jgi:hypothetical protein
MGGFGENNGILEKSIESRQTKIGSAFFLSLYRTILILKTYLKFRPLANLNPE